MISASIKAEKYKTVVTGSGHEVVVDEPFDLGGMNTGFTPLELLSGSLASCVAITLRMYADRKKWQVDEIKVDVEVLDLLIKKTIYISGNLDETQLTRLSAISANCPIGKILGQANIIETIIFNQE